MNKSDVDENRPDSSLQHFDLNVELKKHKTTPFIEAKFQGMREENVPLKLSVRMPRPTTGIYIVVVELIG